MYAVSLDLNVYLRHTDTQAGNKHRASAMWHLHNKPKEGYRKISYYKLKENNIENVMIKIICRNFIIFFPSDYTL